MLIIGSLGAVKTETLTAIPDAKELEILKELPEQTSFDLTE
jgi:uncharacterized protein with GYD domain